jgi:hypothetical protein
MAVVTTKAAAITNRDATPRVPNLAGVTGGILRSAVGTVELASGDSIASKYLLIGNVPSGARIDNLKLYCDAISTSGAGDIGLYDPTAAGGAVVDQDFFASAVVLTSALNGTDVTHEAGGSTAFGDIARAEMPLWQALGLSSDPCKTYDIVLTLTAAAGGAGTVTLKAQWAL